MAIELPKEIKKAEKLVPSSMVIFGLPKCGKTTALSQLPNCLIIDAERGSGYVDALKLQPEEDIKPVALFKWIKEIAASIKAAGRPYDFVAVDTVSYLDEISEWVGTFNYMNSPQGKKFNRWKDDNAPTPDLIGKMIPFGDSNYESVHTLGEGYGYRYSRAVMTDLFDSLKNLGKISTIFVCHVKDKYVVNKQSNTEVRTIDLSLTGKVRDIYARDVDAIGYIWNLDGEVNISFKGNENKIGGMRGNSHLQSYEGPLNWKELFQL